MKKLAGVERIASAEHGPFRLFGLFMRENSNNLWDIVVAASWFPKIKPDALEYVSNLVTAALATNELMMTSRIVTLAESDRFLEAVNEVVEVDQGLREIENIELAGVEISRAYILTSLPQVLRKR